MFLLISVLVFLVAGGDLDQALGAEPVPYVAAPGGDAAALIRLVHVLETTPRGLQKRVKKGRPRAAVHVQFRSGVKDYELLYTDSSGKTYSLVKVQGNYQRLRRHHFPPIQAKSLRLNITATNGSETARVYEIRCYA